MKLILWQPETLAAIAADNKYEYCVSHFRFEFAFLHSSPFLLSFCFFHFISISVSTLDQQQQLNSFTCLKLNSIGTKIVLTLLQFECKLSEKLLVKAQSN